MLADSLEGARELQRERRRGTMQQTCTTYKVKDSVDQGVPNLQGPDAAPVAPLDA
jgi:hypothetical protein